MKIPRLQFVCLLCFLATQTPQGMAQPPANSALMQKTQNEVTVRLLTLRWAEVEQVMEGGNGGYPSNTKGLLLTYNAQRNGGGVSVSLSCLDPNGKAVQGYTYQSALANENLKWFTGVDPRWPKATLQFDWIDPKAPPYADGSFSETLEFIDLPLPEQKGVVKAVNKTLTTKRGTQVTIEKIARPKEGEDYGGQTVFIVHVLPPQNVPDLTAYVQIESAVDNTGKDLGIFGDHSDEDNLEHRPGRETLSLMNPPSSQAKSLRLKVNVTEKIPSLRQQQWYRRVSFDFAPNTLRGTAPRAASPSLSTAKMGDVEAAVESFTTQPGNTFEVKVHVYSPGLPPDHQWALKDFDLRDAAKPLPANGEEIERDYWANDQSQDYKTLWKSNGAPLRNGEAIHTIQFDKIPFGEDKAPKPQKFNLTATAALVQKTSGEATFNEIPIPQPGQVIAMEKVATLDSGTRLILRKVGHFDPKHPLQDESVTQDGLNPPWGFALVYEIVSVRENASARFDLLEARDDKNRPLNDRSGVIGTSRDVWQKEGVEGRWWTVFVLPTYPDAGNFSVKLRVTETIPTGRQEKITFRDLPAPKQSPADK